MRLALHIPLPDVEEKIRALFPALELIPLPIEGDLPADADADILLTIPVATTNLDKVLTQFSSLKWVHVFGTGVNNFPFELLRNKQLSCSRGATAVAIAEWVMAMILARAKRLPDSWVTEPPATWNFADLQSMQQQTLGIIGFGAIGQAVARRALAFDMRVIAKVRNNRPSPLPGVELLDSLDSVLAESDHLVLALPATQESHHLLDHSRLSKTKPDSHLINVARAGVLDHDALKVVLDSGHLACASIDVTDPEPLPAGHWLYSHPSVRLSPHISWNSPDAFDNMGRVFIDNLRAFLAGKPLQGLVDPGAGY